MATENNRLPDLRLIGVLHPLRDAVLRAQGHDMRTIADLKGKRVIVGLFGACASSTSCRAAVLATAGLTEADVRPVLVPNVVRSADDFVAGTADMFFFAFGAPKVREADATVGGIRALEIPESGMPAARKIYPGAIWRRPRLARSTSASTSRWGLQLRQCDFHQRQGEGRFRLQDDRGDGEEQGRSDRGRSRRCAAFTRPAMYKKFSTPYHPGALKYFADNKIEIKTAP